LAKWTNRPDRETAAALHESINALRGDLESVLGRFQELERFCLTRTNHDALDVFHNLAAEFEDGAEDLADALASLENAGPGGVFSAIQAIAQGREPQAPSD
jgi:hypothetical protein